MSIVTGVLVDRFGALSLTPFYLLPMVCSTLVIAFCDASWTIVLFMALAGTTGGATATIISTMWAELYGVLHLGSIKAMVAGIQVISSALGPAVFGLLIDVYKDRGYFISLWRLRISWLHFASSFIPAEYACFLETLVKF